MSVTITTNHHEYPVIFGFELTPKEREEFDYIDWDAVMEGRRVAEFVRYKGRLYDLGDTEGVSSEQLAGWDAYVADSFFSGVVFRWPRLGVSGVLDMEHVVCGTYFVS